jgi:hypothetical protein
MPPQNPDASPSFPAILIVRDREIKEVPQLVVCDLACGGKTPLWIERQRPRSITMWCAMTTLWM